MQYHYVIGYDTEKSRWFVEFDTYAYFHDGNVWSDKQFDETSYGWMVPDDDSDEAALDQELLNTLYSLVDVIPIPKENAHAS